ncbi:MAG: hypothetical protein Q9174_006044 [Haloplaca sp. 1 TL-2023]
MDPGNVAKTEDGLLGGVSDLRPTLLVDELIKFKLKEPTFSQSATIGEGLTKKRKAENAMSDSDMEDGEIKKAEDHEEKSDVKDGKQAGKKAKTENPFLLQRPFAPPLNTKPREPRDPKHIAMLKNRIKFNKPRHVHPRTHIEREWFLRKVVTLVSRGIESHQNKNNVDIESLHSELRKHIHKLEHCDWITQDLLELTLVKEDGLTRLVFHHGGAFPEDIVDDASAIYYRWCRGERDGNLLRGIEIKQGHSAQGGKRGKGSSYTLEPGYKHINSARYGGDNGLVNGQWWALQVAAVRDGAHGDRQAGISGVKGKGAQSIILAGGGYKDIDNGEDIDYCGTSGSKGHPTEATKLMNEAWKLGAPVRVLRSSTLPKTNKYRPAEGIRYDGLYEVVDSKQCDEATAMYRFQLKRQANQGPIRFEGPAKRPTEEDLKELKSAFTAEAA